MLRPATIDDLDSLIALEQRAFTGDRLSRRALRYLLTAATTATLVDEHDGRLRGYAIVLFHRQRAHARLYSIAVDSEWRGRGIGQTLLTAIEQAAADRGATAMRLELRRDNAAALAMYKAHGYRPVGARPHYYEDGADAILMERPLTVQSRN
jgi:ribosomal-protein-alanine acetyltransferase